MKSIGRFLALTLPFILCSPGCVLTIHAIDLATDPHPSFTSYPRPSIERAALHGNDLYLELKPKSESESLKEGDSLLVRIRIKDLKRRRFRQLSPFGVEARIPRLPIRVAKSAVLPDDAIPVAVQRITIGSLEEWNEVVVSASGEPEVRVVFVEDEAVPMFPFVASPNSGLEMFSPIIAISLPSLGADSKIVVAQEYVQKPRGRRAWLLLTPLTLVADVVTFPFQLYLLTLD
jgi:hypothetical protein